MSTAKANAATAARMQARLEEYVRDWADQPLKHAARHFGVANRTIGRWRERLGLPDARLTRGDKDG